MTAENGPPTDERPGVGTPGSSSNGPTRDPEGTTSNGEATGLPSPLAYAAHGWPVFPLHGKRPLIKDWPNAASSDPEVVEQWGRQWPRANVGVVTGSRSGVVVLDVDPRHGGTESLAALEAKVGVLPGTVVGVTGSGGLHLLFAHPGTKVTTKPNAFGPEFPGLDVKGDGGFIVAPPSGHPETGRVYRWQGGVWSTPLPVWPIAQLAPLLPKPRVVEVSSYDRPRRGGGDRRLAALIDFVLTSQEGERNARIHWAACRACEMVNEGADEDVVRRALELAADALGYPAHQAATTIASAFRSLRVPA